MLSFVVEKDGSVSSIEKLQSPDASLWEEARRVIASSPKWKPGEQRGQIVRVKYTLPVDFRSYESVRYAGPGIRKVVFQPATTKQTARRHNPDSPNRPARIPRINRLHESAARPAFPKPSSRGPASPPDFQAPAGSPHKTAPAFPSLRTEP